MATLDESLARLGAAVADLLSGRSSDSRRILRAAFAVNNEVGPLLRSSGDPGLKAIQLMVNDVTVAAKAADPERLREAMEKLSKEAAGWVQSGRARVESHDPHEG